MHLLENFLWFALGSAIVLCLGSFVWNFRLLYYRTWCWWNYGRKGIIVHPIPTLRSRKDYE